MIKYIISKYNPKLRDETGCFTGEEWTSISDVGESFNGSKVTIQEIIDMEDRYLKSIDIILGYLKIDKLYVMELEGEDNIAKNENTTDDLYKINSIKEGQKLNRKEINCVIRATLREIFWCGLYSKSTHIIIKPGYDFYINIICPELPQYITNQINELGLYIEK